MWVAKIKLNGENSLFGSRTKKHNVCLKGYPLSESKKDGKINLFVASEVYGLPENIEKFIEDLSEADEILKIEKCNRFFIVSIRRDSFFKVFYNLNLVHFKPIFINEHGENFFEIGSFNRKDLTDFVELTEEKFSAELSSITEEPVEHLSIISPYPNITLKQKEAFELAIKKGYYNFPKKIGLKELAKIKGKSFSTFRAHLKKAESKLMGFIFEHL